MKNFIYVLILLCSINIKQAQNLLKATIYNVVLKSSMNISSIVKVFAISLLIITMANNTKAQVTNQVLWVKADKGVNSSTGVPAATNTQITTWYDQTTTDGTQNGGIPTVDPGQPEANLPALPYYKYSSSATDNFNHNPVINFSYLNYGNAVQFTTPALGSQTVFTVFKAAGYDYYYNAMLLYGGDVSNPSAGDPAPERADMGFNVYTGSRLSVWGGSAGDYYGLGNLQLKTQISIGTLKRNRVGDENVTHSIYGNGSTDVLNLNADPDNSRTGEGRYLTGLVRIGKQFSGPTDINNPIGRLDGQFAELMVYNTVLSDADRAKVESYLAVKYGITLTGGTKLLGSTVGNSSYDYVNSSGTIIRASDATYKYDVFGLGRDDYFGLDQRISKSNNTNDILTASTNSNFTSLNLDKTRTAIDGDKEFMLIANNKGSSDIVNTQTTELPTDVTSRLDREWKVNYFNTDGTNIKNVSLKFDLSGFTFTGATIDNLMLLIDTDGDGDFTTGTVSKIPASTFFSGSYVSFDNINLTTGNVFTLGIVSFSGTITGTVFNDPNGGNVNNSSGTTNAVPSGIYANLINNATGIVVASVSVATTGTYTFSSVVTGTYYVSLTKVQATVGATAPSPSLPSFWMNTGEYIGAENTGTDGAIDGKSTTFTITTANQSNVNFGITLFPIPTVTITEATCSVAGTATISNYNSAYTYTFNPTGPSAGTGGAITGMTAGTNYTVSATSGPCMSAASTSFSVSAMLTTPATPTVTTVATTCNTAGIATISNYNSAYTYTFSPTGPSVGTGGAINSMTTGTNYTVTATLGSCSSLPSNLVVINSANCDVVCNAIVDDFNITQSITPINTSVANDYSVVTGVGILGGERDVALINKIGTLPHNFDIEFGYGYIDYAQGSGQKSTLVLQWDGIDNDASALNPIGLGGISFNNVKSLDFHLTKDLTNTGLPITVELYTNAGNASSLTKIFNTGDNFDVSFKFSEFSTLLGLGVDLNNIGAVVLKIDPSLASGSGLDLQLNNFNFGCSVEASCYKPAQTTGTTLDTNHGITALGRAGADNSNWPMVRKGAWTALEAKTKGFVVNRIATTASVESIANPVEGMMVYDEEAACLKIYTTTDGTNFSWKCFNTPACP